MSRISAKEHVRMAMELMDKNGRDIPHTFPSTIAFNVYSLYYGIDKHTPYAEYVKRSLSKDINDPDWIPTFGTLVRSARKWKEIVPKWNTPADFKSDSVKHMKAQIDEDDPRLWNQEL